MTKKAAIYLRVSSIDQNYERQEIELKALAKCLGYEVKYIFEEKRSAVLKMDTRDELTQMRKLTKNEIDRIFIWDITRLSRRAIDFITLINEFTDKGICLHFKDKNIITLDEDGKQDMFVSMYLYILGLFAQMDAENLKAKMRSGRERGLAIGHAYTGCAPYGYKLINKQLYIDEKEAETVRAIFNNYVDGKSIQHIIDILNSNKIPTRTGILWTRNSIYAIITNPVYKGKPELTSITKRDENKKPLEKITRVFKAPVIIESPIWDEAQVQRKKHKSFIDKSKEREALLRGILQCGNCGKAYCTAINGSGVPTYICSDNRANINQKLNCKNGGVACYFLDSICWQTIKDIYAYKNFQDTFTKEKAKNQQLLQENQTQINNFIDKQIELDKENERVNKGYRIGIYTDSEAIRAKGEINNNKARYEKMIEELKNKIFSGEMITKDEAMSLIDAPLDELCKAADEIREKFCDNVFDICTIINAKSGRCSEDCKYCAQSAFHCTNVEEYPLLDKETVVNAAKKSADKGIKRFSLVASGKRLSDSEVDKVCEIIKEIRKISDISVCASLGLLNEEQFKRLKDAGLTRVHNNLEIIFQTSVQRIHMTIK